jgi:hypothetical protein
MAEKTNKGTGNGNAEWGRTTAAGETAVCSRAVTLRKPSLLLLVAFLSSPRLAAAAEPADADARRAAVPSDLARMILDDGRVPFMAPDEGHIRLEVRGEYQMRWQSQSSFFLTPTATTVGSQPGAIGDSLGQNGFLWQWLRVTPKLMVGKNLSIVAQADLGGLVAGDLTHDVSYDQTPRDTRDGFTNLQPRWLYLEWLTKIGLFRAGQMGNHWGMGIVANDGDHPSLFGDYRYGNISDSILFATKPAGESSPFVVAASGGFVFKDNFALLSRGDHAVEGILAAFYEKGPNQLGVYGVYRHQTRDRTSGSDLFPFTESIDAGVVDVAGHFAAPVVAPDMHAWVFGAAEAATILGATNEERTLSDALSGTKTTLRSYGGAAVLGVVFGATHTPRPDPRRAVDPSARPDLFGRFVGQVEVGYASGDADPYDGVERRFTFDPNHKVGLLLFDEVMRWQTARAASAARDPNLTNVNNPPPGVDLLPSNGGVFGAQYVNPTAIYRPLDTLDLKAGVVVAQTTADVVDPYRLVTSGSYVNFRGGNPQRHDLGVEVDAGAEWRIPVDHIMNVQVGAQGGVLAPGGALADAAGVTLRTPWIAIGRLGVQF